MNNYISILHLILISLGTMLGYVSTDIVIYGLRTAMLKDIGILIVVTWICFAGFLFSSNIIK